MHTWYVYSSLRGLGFARGAAIGSTFKRVTSLIQGRFNSVTWLGCLADIMKAHERRSLPVFARLELCAILMHIHTHACMYLCYACVYIYVYMSIHVQNILVHSASPHAWLHDAPFCVCMCVFTYVYACVCVYSCLCVCTFWLKWHAERAHRYAVCHQDERPQWVQCI